MKIGQIADKSGLSRDTIRLYEQMGLLIGITRPNEYNNYKDYPASNLQRLEMIKAMKKFGFTLKEISEALCALATGEGLKEEFRVNFLGNKIKALDEKIAELQKLRDELSLFLNQECTEHDEMQEIANAQMQLSQN